MLVTVVRPGELGATEAQLWAEFQRRSPDLHSPFLSLTFAKVVDRARPSARVAIAEEAGSIEAFLPFEVGSDHIGLPLGAPMNDLQGLVSSGVPLDMRAIVRGAKLRGWRFFHAPEAQSDLSAHRYAGTTVNCPVMEFGDGFEAYLSKVRANSKSLLTKNAGQRRALERRVGEITLEWDAPTPDRLAQLVAWKSETFQRMQTYDLFSDRSAVQIIEEIAVTREADCRGLVNTLSAPDHVIATHLSICGPQQLGAWFMGYDSTLSQYSVGTILILTEAQRASEEGYTGVDLGYGQHWYKFRLATGSYPVSGGAVWASGLEKGARALYRRFRERTRNEKSGARPPD